MITNIDLDLKIAHVHCSVLNNNASQVGQDRFTFPMYYINFVALLLYLFLIELRFICFIWVTLLTKVRRGTMVMCSAGDQRVLIRLQSISTSLITQFCYITTFGLVTLARCVVISMGRNRTRAQYRIIQAYFKQGATVLPMPQEKRVIRLVEIGYSLYS